MTRIKLLAISTVAAVMILGSSIVLASAPAEAPAETVADQPSMATDLADDPTVRRGGGGAGHNLKK